MIDIEAIAQGFKAALDAGALYDPPSARVPLDLDQAYAVQALFNRLRAGDDVVAGFKAGVNAPGAQRALGLAGPVTGALFASGARMSGASIARSGFQNLVLETELGFRAARRIDKPIDTVESLRAAIASVAPMFELADPRFGRVEIRGTDMVAANLACGGYVEGSRHSLDGLDLNSVTVRLDRDGVMIHEARADELMGDHWLALRWLVNTMIGRGEVIEAGQLLMTGALGGPHPALPGVYTAVFSSLGRLAITVV